jgi:hypothetical protein
MWELVRGHEWELTLVSALVVLVLGIAAAAIFEAGRASFKKEIMDSWREAACRECGAMPEPRIMHVSGCESGWPDPAALFEQIKNRR